MIDVPAQIAYWKSGAEEDWQVAVDLVRLGRVRHGLFFAHLALEKVLKAHVCRVTRDVPPRLHLLLRLAERTASVFPKANENSLPGLIDITSREGIRIAFSCCSMLRPHSGR